MSDAVRQHRSYLASKIGALEQLIGEAVDEVSGAIDRSEHPECVAAAGDRRCTVERRRVGDAADAGREGSGEEVARGSIKGADA